MNEDKKRTESVDAKQGLKTMRGSGYNERPRVLSLHNQQFKMGELNLDKTRFELRANPRINQTQAALFTDKKQQINSPMFQKKLNPAIYNEQAVKAGASYFPDGSQ